MTDEHVTPKGPPPIRVAVCMPTRGSMDYKTAQSLAEMTGMAGCTLIADGILDMTLMILPGTYVDKARTQLAEEAIAWGATHILWLDDDMIFPPYTLHKLLAANADIVGANYPMRKSPVVPTAFTTVPSKTDDQQGVRCYTTAESGGLQSVEAIGFGCVLMKTSVFAKVAHPGFLCHFNAGEGTWTGEDVYFCLRAREAGFLILVDHDLSKDIGHAGRMVFTCAHAEAVRELEQRETRIVTAGAGMLDRIKESPDGAGFIH